MSILCIFRLVVAVLDAFHFDLSLAAEIHAIARPQKTDSTQVQSAAGVNKGTPSKKEEQVKEEQVKEDDDDDEEEEAGSDDEEEQAEDADEEDAKRKAVAMATRIHSLIVSSILPQLHGTITKKVCM